MGNSLPKIAASNEFKIERDVPVPPNASRNLKYPFPSMEVGDSFFVSGGTQRQLSSAAVGWGGRNGGKKFSCRPVDGGVRVWRIA